MKNEFLEILKRIYKKRKFEQSINARIKAMNSKYSSYKKLYWS